jgi:hypothetical protein
MVRGETLMYPRYVLVLEGPMSISRWFGLCTAAAAVLLGSAGPLSARPYRDANLHCALELPADWDEMTPDELGQIREFARQSGGMNVNFTAGFRPRNSPPGSYPYVLVQWQKVNTAGASYDQIERELARELKSPLKHVKGPLKDLVENVSIGSPVLDRERSRYLLRMQMQVPGAGAVEALSVGHLGKDGVVSVHGYAESGRFAHWLPTFTQLNDSFQYDGGYGFTPGSGSGILSGAARGAWIGALVGALLGLVAWLRRKWKKTAPPSSEPPPSNDAGQGQT